MAALAASGTALVGSAATAGGAAATSGLIGTAGAVTAGGIASAASIGAGAIGALGSIEQSRASAAAAGYNSQVAAQNAQLATQNAQFAGAQGEQQTAAEGAKTKAAVGATLANEGESGIDVNSGSNVDVRESEAKIGMLNALTIRSNAAKSAYGFQTQSVSDTGQAALDKSQQSSDITGGYLSAGANVLGGISNAAKFSRYLNDSSPIPNGN